MVDARGDEQACASLHLNSTHRLGLVISTGSNMMLEMPKIALPCCRARKLKFADPSQQSMAPLFVQDARKRQTSHDEDSCTLEAAITQLTKTIGHTHLFNSSPLETQKPNPLTGGRGAKRHATKTRAPSEARITRLTNTVRDAHLFDDSPRETQKPNPRKGRRRPKQYVTKITAPIEATIIQLINTVGNSSYGYNSLT